MDQKHKEKDKEVIEQLQKFEYHTLKATGMCHLSGGFSEAEIVDEDDDNFQVDLCYGVQSDCEDRTYREHWLMDKRTLKILEEGTV